MAIGNDYYSDGQGRYHIMHATTSFRSSDALLFVANLPSDVTPDTCGVVIRHQNGGEVHGEVCSIMPDSNEAIGSFNTLGTLLGDLPPGNYVIEVQVKGQVVASAGFTYLG